jgi:poly(A) polymerase
MRETAKTMVQRLQSAGFEAFWVGGCVRDLLLGREAHDYDIVTNARTEAIEKLFPHTIPVGRQFGVVVVVENGMQFQVATFRAESDYQDGRRPGQVSFGDARADALRRDFTINGLLYDPVRETVVDLVEGETDLRRRLVRAIGRPEERFAEDHLRLLRAVRFAVQLGFEMEEKTFAAVQAAAPLIRRISAERVRDELLRIFRPPHAARGLDLLRDSGLLREVLPELAATVGCLQSPDHHPEGDVYAHVRLMLEHLPADAPALLPWAVLMHDIAKPVTSQADPLTGRRTFYAHEERGAEMAREILERLRFPRKEIEDVAVCVRYHMQFLNLAQMRKSTLRRMVMRPTFPLEMALHRLDCLGSRQPLDSYDRMQREAASFQVQPQLLPPLLSGNDLIALGVPTGPVMGKLLAEIREKQLQDELTTPEAAREWVKAHWQNR